MRDLNAAHNEWPLASVVEANSRRSSGDGLVRRVKVKLGTHKKEKTGERSDKLEILERPVQKLVLLLENPRTQT